MMAGFAAFMHFDLKPKDIERTDELGLSFVKRSLPEDTLRREFRSNP